jgi:pimeloyl-ACP methyl ester carboxylesterase
MSGDTRFVERHGKTLPDSAGSKENPMRFLLIHGGWQGGWCWDAVTAELRRRGHEAYAPTLPGCGPDDQDRRHRGMAELARHAAGEIPDGAGDVVVVGHSGGGPVAQAVYEQIPARVRQVVFVDAFVLFDGGSIFDDVPVPMVEQFTAAAAATPDLTLPMPQDLWVRGLCGGADEEAARRWLARTVPLPIGWLEERVSLPAFAASGVPTAYVFLADDVGLFGHEMFERQASRLVGPVVTTCPGSHEAMLTHPVALAGALLAVAGE